MWFLMNNPWVLLIGLVVTGLIIYTVIQIKNEISINKLLKNKQFSMRLEVTEKVRFSRKMKILTTSIITPIIVVAFVLAISVGNTTNSDLGTLAVFNTASDIEQLYSNFAAKVDSYSEPEYGVGQEVLVSGVDSSLDYMETPANIESDYLMADEVVGKSTITVNGSDEISNAITDNTYIYSINNDDIVVTLAYTESLKADALEVYKNLPQGDFTVNGMYVDENYLVVVRSDCNSVENVQSCSGVSVLVYDKDKGFDLIDSYLLTGTFIGTKKIEENVVIITSEIIPFENVEFSLEDYLPSYNNGSTTKAMYQDIIYSEGTYPNSFITIFDIDLENKGIDMEVVLGDSNFDVYISESNIYLAGNAYVFDSFSKLVDLENPISLVKTAVMKLELHADNIEYVNTGFIDGFTLNQISMKESNNQLIIVTTSVAPAYQTNYMISSWNQEIVNKLWILDSDLNIIGEVSDQLVPDGETIQSATFIGDYCYISTFEQSDSLNVIDMSDSENPIVIGPLGISGQYEYLKPIDNDYVLGVQIFKETSEVKSIVVSTYYIRDISNPVLHDQYTLVDGVHGLDWSTGVYNFTKMDLDMASGLLMLPYNIAETGEDYNGLVVFNIDSSFDINSSYNVSHETAVEKDISIYKSLIINDYLYTLSNKYIKVSIIDDPTYFVNSVILD